MKDEKTGDYKAQEEHRTGDSVTGTYVVGEPNGDLRVVSYTADVSNGFKADVSVQPGASPVKGAVTNPPKDGIAAFNNYRTGISAPPRNRNKPARGFHPIVVKRLSPPPATALLPEQLAPSTPASHPYPYFKDATNASSLTYATTPVPKKAIHVDVTFNDDAVPEKSSEVSMLQQKNAAPAAEGDASHPPTANIPQAEHPPQTGLQQLANMAIPSSIMEIMSQHKSKAESHSHIGDTTIASSTTPIYANFVHADHENGSPRIDVASGSPLYESDSSTEPSATAPNAKKIPLPQRPMRLIGLSPIYMEISQLQSIADNLTTIPQIQLEPFTNMQYATPAPFQSGPLAGGPAGPFRNLPRAVSETSAELPLINTIPIANSIPISAPIIPQPFASNDFKGDVKIENKTPSPATLPLCTDCLLPANYGPYPLVKVPIPISPPNNQKAPCPPTSNNTPYWAPYTPSLAYILMPTQILKGKFNETRY